MACFVVPAAEAVITTVAAHIMRSKEKAAPEQMDGAGSVHEEIKAKVPFSRKLKWLSNLLWGGSSLLAFEHLWHGEVMPWFPFLTAASDPASASVMLHEMATVGLMMALLVTAVWGAMLLVVNTMEKKGLTPESAAEQV